MSSSLLVVDIFANYPPVFQPEYFLSKYLVGVVQAIENKSIKVALVNLVGAFQNAFHTGIALLTRELCPRGLFMCDESQ